MKRIVTAILTAVLFSTLAFGCTAAKKPLTPGPAKKVAPMPTSSRELHKLATKLATEAAKVEGVKKATVAMSKTTAYVGLDLNANIEASKTNAIKREVKDRVARADKRLTRVYVSTDADLVTRIKKVAKGIEQGKPVSTFARELEEIGRRITP